MIKKISIFAAAACLTALATTPNSRAQSSDSDQQKAKELFKEMRQFPNALSRPGPIIDLATRLVKLYPIDAKRYYKTAVVKYLPAFTERKAKLLRRKYVRLLTTASRSGEISVNARKNAIRAVKRIEKRVILRNKIGQDPAA